MCASTTQSNVQMQHFSHENASTPLTEIDKTILTASGYKKRDRISQEILRKNKDEGTILPDFKICYEATIVKIG